MTVRDWTFRGALGAVALCLWFAGASAWGLEQAASPAAPPKPVLLFILSGQSNAGGKGIGDELPAEYRKTDPDLLTIGRRAKGLVPIAPYHREGFGSDNTAFGCETSFAHEIKRAFPGDVVVIAKQTEGGCTIVAWDKHWQRPDWKSDLALANNVKKPAQYPRLMAVVKEAREAIAADPKLGPVTLAGMLWVQGERDDHSPQTAALYEKNLRALIANVRGDLGAPRMPFLFADINGHRNVATIHAGMQRIVRDVPRTAMVPVKDLSREHGGVHYNAAGQVELGRRFAAAYLKLVVQEPHQATAPNAAPEHRD